MASWVREVPLTDLKDDTLYFLARRWESTVSPCYLFHSTLLNGKQQMTSKPGIANRFRGEKLKDILTRLPDHVAVAIPADANTRWTARKRRY